MKRTELKRRTALKSASSLKGNKSLTRKPMKQRRAKPKISTDDRWRSDAYLRWVRQQFCCLCYGKGGDAHHVIGLRWGLSGAGLTAPDNYAMPLCRTCHTYIHSSPELQGLQPGFLWRTLCRAQNVFGPEGEVGRKIAEAKRFLNQQDYPF